MGRECMGSVQTWRPDGKVNALHIMRLQDKLGNWSNASSEVRRLG